MSSLQLRLSQTLVRVGILAIATIITPIIELTALGTTLTPPAINASTATPSLLPLLRRLRQQPENTIKFAIPPQFDYASLFFRGRAQVELNDKAGLIDKSGKFVVEPQFGRFSNLLYFTEGLGLVEKDGIYGYIDKSGKIVVPFGFAVASVF